MSSFTKGHRGVTLAVAILLATAAAAGGQRYDRSILDDPARPAEERQRDAGTRPLEIYAWFGIQPGMTVTDIVPISGYNAHLLGRIVGPEGKVLAAYAGGAMEQLRRRFTDAGLDNVTPIASLAEVADDSVDVHVTVRNVHDLYIPSIAERVGLDRERVYRDLLRTLKPGGILGVVDARTPKEGVDDQAHRINEQMVIGDLEAVGFELVDRSDLLAVENDDYETGGFPTRWNIDRFLLKFRKPR